MKDVKVWLPNAPGLACALLQIGLKLFYGNGGGEIDSAVESVVEAAIETAAEVA